MDWKNVFKPNWKNILLTIVIITIMFFIGRMVLFCFDCAPNYGIPFFVYSPGGPTGWGDVPVAWNIPSLIIQVLIWYAVSCLILRNK